MQLFDRSVTVEEARAAGRAAGAHFVNCVREHKKWCRETFGSEYKTLPTPQLISLLYETQRIYSWCAYNPRNNSQEKILQAELPYTETEFKKAVVAHFAGGCERATGEHLIAQLLEYARKEGYSFGARWPCLDTTPFLEEIELMVEELKQRLSQ